MRWLSFLGARYGIALVLTFLIAAFVVTFKLAAPGASPPDRSSAGEHRPAPMAPAVPPPEGDDHEPVRAPAEPVTSPGAAPPQVVALSFAQAWVQHVGVGAREWLAGLAPYATAALQQKLADTDPAVVPADRVTGEPIPGAFTSQSFVEYQVAVDSGTLLLRLVSDHGRWKVDTVDWERAQ